MKTFVKNYIGKGKGVAGGQIAMITCKLEDLEKFAYFYKDGDVAYVTFEVAKMKQPDNFGREYTVYVNTEEEVDESEPKRQDKKASAKPATNKKKTVAKADQDELPF